MQGARGKIERGTEVADTCGRVLEKIVGHADELSQCRRGHQAIHRELVGKLSQFEHQLGSPQLDVEALMAFLNNWLVKHILGADMRYAKHSKTGNIGAGRSRAA